MLKSPGPMALAGDDPVRQVNTNELSVQMSGNVLSVDEYMQDGGKNESICSTHRMLMVLNFSIVTRFWNDCQLILVQNEVTLGSFPWNIWCSV